MADLVAGRHTPRVRVGRRDLYHPGRGGDPIRLPIPQIRVTRFPAWAPGSDIAFSSDGDLYATTEDGSELRRLTETSTTESIPAWSPDGSSLAFELSYWVDAANR